MRPPRSDSQTRSTLTSVDPAQLLRGTEGAAGPVMQIVVERAIAGSRPGSRSDEHFVCLAVEGGGMRGAVSAGMCVMLEAAGLIPSFDRIYGVSAGALNAAAAASGQASLSATHYQDAATRRVINPLRPLRGRAVVDLDFLFGDLIAARKPLSFEALSAGPEFRALAASVDTRELRVLRDFRDIREVMAAIRASASLPALGAPALFRGERLVDGGLIDPIPYETALREGATHVLVLRSRPAGYRKPYFGEHAERLALRRRVDIADLVEERAGTYNRQAAALEQGPPEVAQVAVPDGTRLIRRLQPNPARVVEALRAGAAAAARELFDEAVDLCWQPIAYNAAPIGAAASAEAQEPVASRVPWPARAGTADAGA